MITESIWSTIIQFVLGPALVAIVGFVLKKRIDVVAHSVRDTKQEITNSHPTHLRTDLDSKFALVLAKLNTVTDSVDYGNRMFVEHIEKAAVDSELAFKTLADHENRILSHHELSKPRY